MRKLYYSIVVFLGLFVAFFYFTTTPYFFNKFIAPTIKSYHFDYKKVEGTLFRGFKVEHLSYKNKELSSFVELQFNPLALLKKTVSVNKLVLKDVNKELLKELIEDFKSDIQSEDTTSNTSLDLNFVLKNIEITFKPFTFDKLEVYTNRLQIKEIAFINGVLSLDKNFYYYETNLGTLEFEGEFKRKVLYIDKISMRDIDIQKSIEILKSLESNTSKESKANEKILFLPKKIEIKKLFASLKPFVYKKLDITQVKLQGEDITIDIEAKKLLQALVEFDFITAISDFNSKVILKDGKLTIPDLDIALLNSNELVAFLNNLESTSSKPTESKFSLLDYVVLQEAKIENLNILLKQFSLQKERIKKATLFAKDITFNLLSSQLMIAKSTIQIDSTLAKFSLQGGVDKEISLNEINATIFDGNRLRAFIEDFNHTTKSSNSFDIMNLLPKKIMLQKGRVQVKNLDFKPYIIKDTKLEVAKALFDINATTLIKAQASLYNNSNWGKALLEGDIKNNTFFAKGEANITQTLLDEYEVPLKASSIKPIKVKGYCSLDDLNLTASLQGRDIFNNIKDIDILSSTNKIYYHYTKNKTLWDIDALVSHPLLKRAKLINHLQYSNNKLSYNGVLIAKEQIAIKEQYQEFLKGLKLSYTGDSKGINLLLDTNTLQGKLFAKAYQKGTLEIKNKKVLNISKLVGIKDSKIRKLLLKAPVDFNNLSKLSGDILLDANLLKLQGRWSYDKSFKLEGKILDSQLIPKTIKKKALFPAQVKLLFNKELQLELKNTLLKATMLYNLKNDAITLETKTASLVANAKGDSKNISIKVQSASLAKTLKEIQKLYPFKLSSKIDGRVDTTIETDFRSYSLQALSQEITITDAKETTKIKNIALKAFYKDSEITLQNYKFTLKEFDFFSSKPSLISFNKDTLFIKKLSINDTAIVSGKYNLKRKQGNLSLKANSFSFENEDYALKSNLNLQIKIIQERYSIKGVVDIIKAKIKKNLEASNAAASDDIIILQQQAKKKSSFYVKNIALELKIKSKYGVIYAQNGSYFIAYPKLKISKRFNRFTRINGSIILDKKSYYVFKEKKLRLKRGKITFKGDSSRAYLNIVMYYQGREYEVYITITGDSSRPIIAFSSNPPLTKEQILAYLLFNDTSAAGTHSQESMLNLVGSTLAKSFFGSIGLKIDKLSIRENGFSIGKAINDKIIIYYNQEGETPSIKTRIDITKSVHSVIEVGEGKQSADIIFSKEY